MYAEDARAVAQPHTSLYILPGLLTLDAHCVLLKLSSSRYLPRLHQRLSSVLRARQTKTTHPKPGPQAVNPELETLAHQRRRLQTLLGMTTTLGETESPAAGQIQDIPLIKPSREIPTTFTCELVLGTTHTLVVCLSKLTDFWPLCSEFSIVVGI